MFGTLKALFIQDEEDSDPKHRTNIAAAALLIETARADFTQGADEQDAMQQLLVQTLDIHEDEVTELLDDAGETVDVSTSLYEFTRVINDHLDPDEKLRLIDAMWAVAYADGDIDKYEEHLIRRVAELIYVAHTDYIRSKLNAAGGAGD